uniref:Uncharacterized protein n=1 Tax=Ixodes ricinus TaxID=34613 RepID=A0A6B0V348_IXORI
MARPWSSFVGATFVCFRRSSRTVCAFIKLRGIPRSESRLPKWALRHFFGAFSNVLFIAVPRTVLGAISREAFGSVRHDHHPFGLIRFQPYAGVVDGSSSRFFACKLFDRVRLTIYASPFCSFRADACCITPTSVCFTGFIFASHDSRSLDLLDVATVAGSKCIGYGRDGAGVTLSSCSDISCITLRNFVHLAITSLDDGGVSADRLGVSG